MLMAMRQGGAKLSYMSLTCALRVVQVGVESGLGQVPLHGALGVSRGAVLLYCCQHTLCH